jgi:hypothetical protein
MQRTLVDTPVQREDSPMAKSPSSKKRANYGAAMKALKGVGVPNQEFGGLSKDGTFEIDPKRLEVLKKKLGKAAWSKVHFVALNAPFKRRSPNPSA